METETYETSDIALASYLLCAGTQLLSINRTNPKRAVFVFNSPNFELIAGWQAGTAVANVLGYYNSYQHLKSMLFRDIQVELQEIKNTIESQKDSRIEVVTQWHYTQEIPPAFKRLMMLLLYEKNAKGIQISE